MMTEERKKGFSNKREERMQEILFWMVGLDFCWLLTCSDYLIKSGYDDFVEQTLGLIKGGTDFILPSFPLKIKWLLMQITEIFFMLPNNSFFLIFALYTAWEFEK